MMVTLSKTTTTTAEGRQTLDLQTDLASIAAHRQLVEAIMHHPHRATATATARGGFGGYNGHEQRRGGRLNEFKVKGKPRLDRLRQRERGFAHAQRRKDLNAQTKSHRAPPRGEE